MYIREVSTKNIKNQNVYKTYKLVKSYRKNGKPRQKVLVSLGDLKSLPKAKHKVLEKRLEELYFNQTSLLPYDKDVEELARFFHKRIIDKEFAQKEIESIPVPSDDKDYQTVDINSFVNETDKQIGGEFLCKQAIDELGLSNYLEKELEWTKQDVHSSMLALLGRLLSPGSERRTAKWLYDNSAAIELYPLKSGKIDRNKLYRVATQLYKNKNQIENYLNRQVEDIFNIKSKIILYDLTNTHFEGRMLSSSKLKRGKNKQKRNDCKQITLALVTDEYGFPKHSDYYEGNISETKTLEKILDDVVPYYENKINIEKPVVIIDAGISSEDNLKMILRKGLDYIAISKKQHKEIQEKVKDFELEKFINKSEQELSAKLFIEPLEYEDEEGKKRIIQESIVYIRTPDKKQKETAIHDFKRKRFEKGLEAIQKTVNNTRGQRKIEQIHQRLGRLKEKNIGIATYFNISMQDDGNKVSSIEWSYNNKHKKKEALGSYFIRTSIEETKEEKIWRLFRTINEVEYTFHTLKNDLDMRPVYHQEDQYIEAHLNMSVLAYYIVSFIRYRLKLKGINHSWTEIKRIMETQKNQLNSIIRKDGKTIWIKSCTRANVQVKQIFDAMHYKSIPYYRKSIII